MKLLLVGAGYVGMHLLKTLDQASFEIYVTTTSEQRLEELKPYAKEVLLLGSNKEQDLRRIIERCDAMVILVAPNPTKSYAETYLATAKLVRAALKRRIKPFYLLYTSSTSVCEGQIEWVNENMPLSPQSPNALILQETETCYLNCNAKVCILRLGGIYGPGRELEKRAVRFSGQEMPGNGAEPTNHIHLDDIIAAITYCLANSLTGLYHLANDTHISRKELYAKLCTALHIPLPLWEERDAKNGYKISNQKIKDAGFVFRHEFVTL